MTITLQVADQQDPGEIIEKRELPVGHAWYDIISQLTDRNPTCRVINIAVGGTSVITYEHGGRIYTLSADAESRSHFCFCVVAPTCEYMELEPDRHGEDMMKVARFLKPIARELSDMQFVDMRFIAPAALGA